MSDCTLIREQMSLLVTESLEGESRERAHVHIENCAACAREWGATRETWRLMGEVPDVPVPASLRGRVLGEADRLGGSAHRGVVVPFLRRPAVRWLAQAAAIVVIAGGAYFAGSTRGGIQIPDEGQSVQVRDVAPFRIAENTVLTADQLSPEIGGSPMIANVRFIEGAETAGQVGMTFDLTSTVTVKGSPDDKSFVNLLAYVLSDRSHPAPGRSDTMQWVRQTYGGSSVADPKIVEALTNVLRSDAHEGVRIKALETLQSLPPASLGASSVKAREALIAALQNDPNPAVRIKAVEALMNFVTAPEGFDPLTVETLRKTATQNDENPYVRVKAAEALSQLNL